MNVLVLGGTRYFGKRLVDLLVGRGYAVTVATRGSAPVPAGGRIQHVKIDRGDASSLRALAATKSWDVVVDQICYSPSEAAAAIEAFEGRVARYVTTSTGSVYLNHGNRKEEDFDPYTYPLRMGRREDFDYGEGKRLAEATFFQKARFPVAAMRIPIVLGPDDYTGRLEFHIDHIREGRPIVVPNMDAETSFISSAEAAKFLLWLVEGKMTGPINASSDGRISIRHVLELIGAQLHKTAEVIAEGPEPDQTPFVDEKTRGLDTRRAKELGFRFEPVISWFPGLVAELCGRTRK
ncbi:MAG: NAD-dependent epimerase/dehydratase family protein [Bdellovibrionota bacterium]